MAPVNVRNRSRSPRRQSRSGRSLLADPVSGLIDGDPDSDQEAIHQERGGTPPFAAFGNNHHVPPRIATLPSAKRSGFAIAGWTYCDQTGSFDAKSTNTNP
ncbi:hypothetical protein AGR4C_pa30006 [Agrobacterium tumefaciens str. Kerr 14]|uniref:Uncharacterized protein n=1 Tax=Agrobacterium tumefaciens str. Kerr 14 TaxID=1183424 RepID=A0A1S7SA54_AGRTU|nr:hypothetical protein AGR4C_pa30006 [Agrobacterium tumefaciens str. Kerr 14]